MQFGPDNQLVRPLHLQSKEGLRIEEHLQLDAQGHHQPVNDHHRNLPELRLQRVVKVLRSFLQLRELVTIEFLDLLSEADVVVSDCDHLRNSDIDLIDHGLEFSNEHPESPLDQFVDIVQVQFIIPTRDGKRKEVVDELEDVGDGVGLRVDFSVFFHGVVVVRLLLLYDVYDDLLEVAVEGAYVDLAQLLLGLVDLLVLDHVLVDQTLVGR